MPAQKFHLLNGFLLMATTLILCSFQTTFWFQIVGGVAAPMMWLLVFLYVSLYRKRTEAIFINYGLALIISPFTSMGLGTLWAITLIFTVVVSFVKERVFWPGTRYFISASALSTVALQLISWLLSRVLENNPIGPQVGPRLMELILTPLWAAPVIGFCLIWIISPSATLFLREEVLTHEPGFHFQSRRVERVSPQVSTLLLSHWLYLSGLHNATLVPSGD